MHFAVVDIQITMQISINLHQSTTLIIALIFKSLVSTSFMFTYNKNVLGICGVGGCVVGSDLVSVQVSGNVSREK